VAHQSLYRGQQLIGQGMANLGGAFFQSYPACGSSTGRAGRTDARVVASTFIVSLLAMLHLDRGIRISVALPVPLRTPEPAR
jgi:MFS superfamily sulfate permease-like transporter